MFWKLSREAEAEAVKQPGAEGRVRTGMDWWCGCGACQSMSTVNKCFCCTELDLVLPWRRGQNTKRLYHNERRFSSFSKSDS